MLGVSQANLADALGITFQQVQKYEHGANRVAASMLCRIGVTLKCPASLLLGETGPASPEVQAVRMLEAFQALPSDEARRQIADLVVALVAQGSVAGSDLRAQVLAAASSIQAAAPSPRIAKRGQARTGRATKAKTATPVKLAEEPPVEPESEDKKARSSRLRRLRADKDVPWRKRSPRKLR